MPTANRNLAQRALPAALVLVLAVFWAMPPTAASCGMSRDLAPSGSVAPPDCCNDGSCPTMTVEVVPPDGILTAVPVFAPSPAVAALETSSPSPVSVLPPLSAPPLRPALLRSPLRI